MLYYPFHGFIVKPTNSINGNTIFEIRRISDNQSMVEPFLSFKDARRWLIKNIEWLHNQ